MEANDRNIVSPRYRPVVSYNIIGNPIANELPQVMGNLNF